MSRTFHVDLSVGEVARLLKRQTIDHRYSDDMRMVLTVDYADDEDLRILGENLAEVSASLLSEYEYVTKDRPRERAE